MSARPLSTAAANCVATVVDPVVTVAAAVRPVHHPYYLRQSTERMHQLAKETPLPKMLCQLIDQYAFIRYRIPLKEQCLAKHPPGSDIPHPLTFDSILHCSGYRFS